MNNRTAVATTFVAAMQNFSDSGHGQSANKMNKTDNSPAGRTNVDNGRIVRHSRNNHSLTVKQQGHNRNPKQKKCLQDLQEKSTKRPVPPSTGNEENSKSTVSPPATRQPTSSGIPFSNGSTVADSPTLRISECRKGDTNPGATIEIWDRKQEEWNFITLDARAPDNFDSNGATVACRELGLSGFGATSANTNGIATDCHHGYSAGEYDFQYVGNEIRLWDCPQGEVMIHQPASILEKP